MDASPSGIQLHASNQLEVLAAQLAERLRTEPSEPLAPERIVVPHPALGRWLRLALASELGIAANLRIELPAEFAWAAMRDTVPTLAKAQPLAPPSLRWRIHEKLRSWQGEDALAHYLNADAATPASGARRRFELANRLAYVYDRCMLYRPEWIRAWQRGETPHWQAELWRQLAEEVAPPAHWVDAIDAYLKSLRHHAEHIASAPSVDARPAEQLTLTFSPQPLPARVSFFGIVALSPSYLDMLRGAAERMEVHLYLLSPCREFWADTRSARERSKTVAEGGGDDHFDEGNPLLALWGRSARDMQALLADDLGLGAPIESYRDAHASTRLGVVQRDILELRTGSEEAPATEAVVEADKSLQIHCCHSAMREAEVLHDRLLDVFAAHPDIEPAHVLILTPSPDDYAPAVESVFAAAGIVPVDVGRRRRRDNAAVQAFLDILALPGSRYASRAVLAPLRAQSVRRRFGIDGELPMLRDALQDAGIRWGIDAAHLDGLGMPAHVSHTWREGARRLLLGYAIADDAAMLEGVVACPLQRGPLDASAEDYERLGGLLRYAEQLFALAEWAGHERAPEDWAAALRDVVDGFFADLPELAEVDAVSRLIDEFEEECRVADCSAPIPFEALRRAIADIGDGATRSSARLADGATLGRLATGQIIPAEVVCVIGMNDRAFPRHPVAASFDLVAEDARRAGDRDMRDEDRFAFLEALLAARRAFIVTYTGRDIRDDTVMPPSVVVNELMEYLAERFPHSERETTHPLQPFSPRYFDGADSEASDIFSYAPAMADVANALGTHSGATRCLTAPLPVAPASAVAPAGESAFLKGRGEATLDELVRFAAAPVRFFFENRLELTLRLDEDDVREEEVFAVGGLDAWLLNSRLLALQQADVSSSAARAALQAEGLLQQGNLGRVEHLRRAHGIAEFEAALALFREHFQAPPLDVKIEVGELTLVGSVAHYHAGLDELAVHRVGALRPQDRIEAWLRLLCVACVVDKPVGATLLGFGAEVERQRLQSPPPGQAREQLALWLAAWQRAWQAPLPFFPDTSWAWATAGKDPRRDAEAKWFGRRYGDCHDPYNRLAFPDHPFGDAFESLAVSLLLPLRNALR